MAPRCVCLPFGPWLVRRAILMASRASGPSGFFSAIARKRGQYSVDGDGLSKRNAFDRRFALLLRGLIGGHMLFPPPLRGGAAFGPERRERIGRRRGLSRRLGSGQDTRGSERQDHEDR